MPATSTGLHIVRKRVKAGDRYFVYAWRGGPRIHTQDHVRPAITNELLALADEAKHRGPSDTLDSIIDQYRESPAFTGRSDATQRDYKLWLNRLSQRFGKVPIRLIPDLRPELLLWRDELAETPRAADRGVGMLGTVLAWALDRNLVAANPATGIKSLHRVNRADLIWEARHWKAVENLPEPIQRVLRLAKLTGLRQSDLLRLSWEHIGRHDIEMTAQKTGARVVIPLYKDLKAELGRRRKGPVMLSAAGNPWTPSGFRTAWQRSRPEGFDRTFHDLRGSFVTVLATRGFTDQEIAYFTGWEAERIAAIRRRYVDRARIAKGMARRLK